MLLLRLLYRQAPRATPINRPQTIRKIKATRPPYEARRTNTKALFPSAPDVPPNVAAPSSRLKTLHTTAATIASAKKAHSTT